VAFRAVDPGARDRGPVLRQARRLEREAIVNAVAAREALEDARSGDEPQPGPLAGVCRREAVRPRPRPGLGPARFGEPEDPPARPRLRGEPHLAGETIAVIAEPDAGARRRVLQLEGELKQARPADRDRRARGALPARRELHRSAGQLLEPRAARQLFLPLERRRGAAQDRRMLALLGIEAERVAGAGSRQVPDPGPALEVDLLRRPREGDGQETHVAGARDEVPLLAPELDRPAAGAPVAAAVRARERERRWPRRAAGTPGSVGRPDAAG